MLPSTTGRVIDEQQIGQPQRPGSFVVDREVVVGMRHRPRVHPQRAVAEIEHHLARNQQRWRDQLAALRQIAEIALQGLLVELAARGQRTRELRVPDELWLVVEERGGAEQMVGMHMREDDVAHRQAESRDGSRAAAPCPPASEPPVSMTATQLVADDEADIGLVAEVARRALLVHAVVDVVARRNLMDGKALGRQAGRDREQPASRRREPCDDASGHASAALVPFRLRAGCRKSAPAGKPAQLRRQVNSPNSLTRL